MTYEEIALHIEVSLSTLPRYYARELAEGPLNANASVIGALLKNATTKGVVDAQKHWTKHRCGWNDTVNKVSVEVTGAEGGPIKHAWDDSEIKDMSNEELSHFYAAACATSDDSVH